MTSKRATVGNIAMRLSRIASQSEIIQPGSTAQHVLHNVTRAAAWNFIALQPPAIPPLSATCEVHKPAREKCPRGVRKPSAAGPQTSQNRGPGRFWTRKCIQEAPETNQKTPKSAQEAAKKRPRGAQERPRRAQDRPRSAQETPGACP